MKISGKIKIVSLILVISMLSGCLRLPLQPVGQNSTEVPAPAEDHPPPRSEEQVAVDPAPSDEKQDTEVPGEPLPQPPAAEQPVESPKPPTDPVKPKNNTNPPTTQPKPGVAVFSSVSEDNLRALNAERERYGLKALSVNRRLNETADWAAREYLQTSRDPSPESIQKKLAPYPELAAAPFYVHRASATGANGDGFTKWFTEKRREDVVGSQSLRENFLNPQTAFVGMACVGGTAVIDGKEQYTMVLVWLFMPQPAPAGISSYPALALDNMAILNTERAGRGLRTLQSHTVLMDLAYLKAKDILENLPYNELAHESEKLGPPHEMIVARVSPAPLATAENLWTQYGSYHSAFMDDVAQKAHDGLMNSEGHRKNMLHPDFTHIGVGVAAGLVDGIYKVVLVQLFITE